MWGRGRTDHAGLDDHALLVRAASGDERAAAALVDRLGPRALASAQRLLGSRAEAEDVVQEGFLRLWRKGADWDAGGAARPGTWLHRVVHNLALDRLRRAGAAWDELDDALPDAGPGVEAWLMAAERAEALEAALAALPPRQRAAVVLRHVEGYANPEIAAMLGCGVEAVESLTARGKRALRRMLEETP